MSLEPEVTNNFGVTWETFTKEIIEPILHSKKFSPSVWQHLFSINLFDLNPQLYEETGNIFKEHLGTMLAHMKGEPEENLIFFYVKSWLKYNEAIHILDNLYW